MIEIGGSHWMRVQFDAAQVNDPGKSGSVIDHYFFGSSAGRERQRDRTQPGRALFWRALLIKRLPFGAVDETLQHHRPILNPSQRTQSDGEIILNKFELSDSYLRREIQFLRVRDLDFLPADRQNFAGRFFCHKTRLPPIIMILGDGNLRRYESALSPINDHHLVEHLMPVIMHFGFIYFLEEHSAWNRTAFGRWCFWPQSLRWPRPLRWPKKQF